MVGIDPATGQLAGSTIQEQTRQALANCSAILEAGRARLDDVAEVGVLLTSPDDFTGMNEAYADVFGADPPARYVANQGVVLPDVLVSIRMTAIVARQASAKRTTPTSGDQSSLAPPDLRSGRNRSRLGRLQIDQLLQHHEPNSVGDQGPVTSTERVQQLGQGRLQQGHRRATRVNTVCGYHSRGDNCTYRRSEAPTHCSSSVAVLRRGPVRRFDRWSFECGRCCLGRMTVREIATQVHFSRRRSRPTVPRSTASSGYPRDGTSKTSLKQTPVRSLISGCQGEGDFPAIREQSALRAWRCWSPKARRARRA